MIRRKVAISNLTSLLAMVFLLAAMAIPASAQEAVVQDFHVPDVGGIDLEKEPAEVEKRPGAEVEAVGAAEVLSVSLQKDLPVTGTDALLLTLGGVFLLGLGVFAVRGGRRRPVES